MEIHRQARMKLNSAAHAKSRGYTRRYKPPAKLAKTPLCRGVSRMKVGEPGGIRTHDQRIKSPLHCRCATGPRERENVEIRLPRSQRGRPVRAYHGPRTAGKAAGAW